MGSLGSEPLTGATGQVLQIENETTDHHVNPDNTSQTGDLLDVRNWLSTQLSGRLEQSAIKLSQRQYDRSEQLIADRYETRLEQFVDVAGETENEDDDDTADTYRDTQRAQRNLSNTVRKYERTYRQYQSAIEKGNQTAARQHARQLERFAERIIVLNQTLSTNYKRIEKNANVEMDQGIRSIKTITTNITTRQNNVVDEVFLETDLRIMSSSSQISYTDPLVARGQLVAENGTAISNREIRLRVHNRVTTVRTDGNGRFTVQYRPKMIHANTSTLSIEYLPRNRSIYLGASNGVNVTIEQIEATLLVETDTQSVSFGDSLLVSATLTVDGRPVSHVPLVATIDGSRIGDFDANRSGTGQIETRIPASIPPGKQQLTVLFPLQNRAITTTATNTTVTIQPTGTTLTVGGERTGTDNLLISGTLQTDDGNEVPNQPVRISWGNRSQSVQTDENGNYSLVLTRSQIPETSNGSMIVSVVFDGEGTNLRSNSISQQIQFESFPAAAKGGGDFRESFQSMNLQDMATIVVGITLLTLVLIAIGLRRHRRESEIEEEPSPAHIEEGTDSELPPDPFVDLSHARSLLSQGRSEDAIEFTYQKVRSSLADMAGSAASDTHWEFFNRCQDRDFEQEHLEALRRLVEIYERVQFTASSSENHDIEPLISEIEKSWSQPPLK